MIMLRILQNWIRTVGLKRKVEDRLNIIGQSAKENKKLLEKKSTQEKQMMNRKIFVVMVMYVQTSKHAFAFGQILPSSGENQGYFSRTLTSPTDSCYTFSASVLSARYCGLACLQHSEETYLFGVDLSTGLCACCDYPLLPKVQDTAWCSYERCPVGFTEVRRETSRFCFQLILTPEYYSVASVNCHEATRQGTYNGSLTSALVRLDSVEKLYAFETFLQNLKAPEDIWIQGVKGNDDVWRYEDGTTMYEVCPEYNSNNVKEIYMRFRTYEMKCSDRMTFRHSYACEANL